MGTVAHYVEVNAPAGECYAWWRGLTNLPQILPDVESVQPKAGSTAITHWKVRGPLGNSVEWDAPRSSKTCRKAFKQAIEAATPGTGGPTVKQH